MISDGHRNDIRIVIIEWSGYALIKASRVGMILNDDHPQMEGV